MAGEDQRLSKQPGPRSPGRSWLRLMPRSHSWTQTWAPASPREASSRKSKRTVPMKRQQAATTPAGSLWDVRHSSRTRTCQALGGCPRDQGVHEEIHPLCR